MSCPDLERLLSVVVDGVVDPEADAHVRSCATCGGTLRLVRGMRAAYRPEMSLPDSLIESRVEWVLSELGAPEHGRSATPWELAVTGTLAFLTVLVTLIVTGSMGSGGVWGPALLCVVSALGAIAYERFSGAAYERDARRPLGAGS